MAPEQTKRARPVPNASQRSKKRQKIEPGKKGTVEKRPVTVDALPWNEVEMPDMFDDAEGFFGLEEVEGVEVVREGNTIKFVCFLGVGSTYCKLTFLSYLPPQPIPQKQRRITMMYSKALVMKKWQSLRIHPSPRRKNQQNRR
jgi:hypothetical protein